MAIKKDSDYRSVDGTSISSKKVSATKEDSAESSGLRRSVRENAWGKQPKTLIKKLDDQTNLSLSTTRKSERSEKILPTTPLKKKPGTSEENLKPKTVPVKNKFQTAEGQETSSPLRRSGRNKKESLLNPSTLKKPVTSLGLLDISVEKSREISPKDLSPEANKMSEIKDYTSESVGIKRKRMDTRGYKAFFNQQLDRSAIPPGSTGVGDIVTSSVQELCVPKITQSEILNDVEVLKDSEETKTQGEVSTLHDDTQITKVPSNVLNGGQPNICLACKNVGKLLCCSGKDCNRSYHPLCFDPRLNEIPPGDWLCPSCLKKKVELGVHSVNQGVESIWDVRDIEVPGAVGLQKQYFVKYKGFAHVHNHWVPETQLLTEAPALVSEFSKTSKVGAWKKEWTMPHCLLDKRLIYSKQQDDHQSHHVADSLCKHEWLVKWIDLGSEHTTWELESAPFLCTPDALLLIEEYENKHCMKQKDSFVQPEKDNIYEHHKFPSLVDSSNVDKNGLETVLEVNHGMLEESLSHSVLHDRYVEYWVPVFISNVQLEQYCAVLLTNSITLRSFSKNDLVDAMRDVLVSTRKCCDHPYAVDPSLQGLLVKGLSPPEYLDVGIKASGKLQLLDTVLSEIRNKGLRVIILFQYISGSGRDTTGDILDDFLRQRFGQDSYERVDGGLPQHRKQAAVNKFNDKSSNRFVFLLEIRACQSSIKLSAVDGIIFFDSDWNPSLDLKALNRMFIDSSRKQIKIFRLYSPFTLEEKVLILATQNVTLDNSLHNINRSTGHQLLKWGASYLFKKLDRFHDADTDCSDISLEASILTDVAHGILGLLCSHDEVHIENSLIVKVRHCDGTYSKNSRLLGERELPNVLDEPQHFWANLLDGRSPTWKYPSGLLQRNRKRVNYFDEPNEVSMNELDGGKKRKKTNIPIPPSPELERNETEPIEKADSADLQPADSSKGEAPDMQEKFHFLLKSNMAKVYEVLQLPDVVKIMAGELLDYIIDNHHISMEPESIFQAFQISLCWNAASLVKNKIYKDKSLAMVKKHLNFSCTEEEANHVYSKMRNLRKMFLEHTISLKEPKYLKDVISLTDDDGPIGQPLAEREACHLQALNVQNAETENLNRRTKQEYTELMQNFLKQFPIEKRVERHFKKIKKNYGTHLARLLMQQQEEMLDLKKQMEQKREEINEEYRLRVAVIRNIHGKISGRSDKLKKIEEEDLSRRMEELQQQKETCLKELEAKHMDERIVEMKKATDKVMQVSDSLIETESIAEHGQTDEASLVVIDEISRSAASDNVCCEEPGSVDRERLQQETLLCSLAIVGSLAVSGPNDPTCDELHQVEFPSLTKDFVSVDETCGGESGTLELESLQQESLIGSTVVANSCNMFGEDIENAQNSGEDIENAQNSGEDIGNADIGCSQQMSIAGSQTGVDSCNNEANLDRVSDAVETTITIDNEILPPAVTGTQLTARSMTSDRPNHLFYGDPLQIEQERLSKTIEQVKKCLIDERAALELARAKELEEINQKYNAKIHEAETASASNIMELDMRRHKVIMNKHLANSFRIKCDAAQYGLSSTSNLQQFIRPTTDGTGFAPSLTNCLSSTSNMQQLFIRSFGRLTTDGTVSTPPLLTHNVLRPRISNMPTWAPPQAVSLPNNMINHQIGGEIRAPAPHLRLRPSYPSAPYNRPVRSDINGFSLLTPVGSIASTENRLGLQTPAGFPSAHPITPVGFASGHHNNPAGFASGHSNNPADFAFSRPNSPGDFALSRPNSPTCFPLGYAITPPPGFISSHPATSAGFSSAHPIMPMSRTEFGVVVQTVNADPQDVSHEVVFLSDDDDDNN